MDANEKIIRLPQVVAAVGLKKSAIYKEQHPKWKALHDHGFFCHRCGHTFLNR